MPNSSSISEFLLLALADMRQLQLLHFWLFLGIYLAALLGNGLISTAVACDQRLHTPMYFFLLNLALLDLGCISTTLPKAMANALWDTTAISYAGLLSYVQIFRAVLRMPSEHGQHKAFSTCLPHLAVVSLFVSTGTFAYLKPPSISSPSLDLVVSFLYSMVPPAVNPLIYSLRNQKLKDALPSLSPSTPVSESYGQDLEDRVRLTDARQSSSEPCLYSLTQPAISRISEEAMNDPPSSEKGHFLATCDSQYVQRETFANADSDAITDDSMLAARDTSVTAENVSLFTNICPESVEGEEEEGQDEVEADAAEASSVPPSGSGSSPGEVKSTPSTFPVADDPRAEGHLPTCEEGAEAAAYQQEVSQVPATGTGCEIGQWQEWCRIVHCGEMPGAV
ncbi:UNVERIFIED_CONTAM: hypothetical protein H355_012170 [Colinus virginianus]|nr:hypothetical protein H355_012170 [Colinus virginianus]